jgi:23S rRNA (cytidine1920-2'-O)/16S rRNA (cytidine1409-2'-O)-methyltransferase
MKDRLDVLLVERGLVESRELAQRIIRAGQVRSGDTILSKPGHKFDVKIPLEVKELPRFASRGGDKLEAAFESFDINVEGLRCLDVGASTGGFTDCLLQHGAKQVFAVDVGKGQLHWKLRNDDRVEVYEGMNARYLKEDDLPKKAEFAVTDVSFISLKLIMPPMVEVTTEHAELITLIKPQFEAGREQVQKGGVVRDEAVRAEVVETIKAFGVNELGLTCKGVIESPVHGPAGNIEFLAWWGK